MTWVRLDWDRQVCPGCRDTKKVRSEMQTSSFDWKHICDRCDIHWFSDTVIDDNG